MRETEDPLLHGSVPAEPGVRLNSQDQVSAEEPTYTAVPGATAGVTPA